MKVKAALDTLCEDIDFDVRLYNKLLIANTEFISRNQEHTRLFSGRNIGCYYIKYTTQDKAIFYDNVFDMEVEDVQAAIEDISTIPKNFKIARDDINLMCFYIAHRFLSNKTLGEKQRLQYAQEALNYFSYRTLVLISSNYFVYPISEAKATSLTERLSAKYVIKNVRNWHEYCQYRSQEYLQSKYKSLLVEFDKDRDLPNAITDLFSRTKDTLKNIYSEFMVMLEREEVIASKSSTSKEFDGSDTVAERVDTIQRYVYSAHEWLVDRATFIRKPHLTVVCDILKGLSQDSLEQALEVLLEHAYGSKDSYSRVVQMLQDVLINAAEYLRRNDLAFHAKSDLLELMNHLVGNVLYARGTSGETHQLKIRMDKEIKQIYRQHKRTITDRNLAMVRNGVYLYTVLLALSQGND